MNRYLFGSLALLSCLLNYALAAPSVGCDAPSPLQSGLLKSSLLESGIQNISVAGQQRQFIVGVSEPYDADTPHALVLAFHGRTSPAAEVQSYYDLEPHAPATLGPTIFVYPVAMNQPDGTFGWWNTGDAPDTLRDFALFDALVRTFSADACIDTNRIFAVGHSLGSSFVNALGCHRSGVLRAVASLGGGPGPGACEGNVAALILHNPSDRLVPFELGIGARDQFLTQNGLSGPPVKGKPRSLNCAHYGAADAPNPVVWCPHTQDYGFDGRYYPHNWPIETGAAVMRFFAALP